MMTEAEAKALRPGDRILIEFQGSHVYTFSHLEMDPMCRDKKYTGALLHFKETEIAYNSYWCKLFERKHK